MNIRRRVRREAAFTSGRCCQREKRERKKPKLPEPELDPRAMTANSPCDSSDGNSGHAFSDRDHAWLFVRANWLAGLAERMSHTRAIRRRGGAPCSLNYATTLEGYRPGQESNFAILADASMPYQLYDMLRPAVTIMCPAATMLAELIVQQRIMALLSWRVTVGQMTTSLLPNRAASHAPRNRHARSGSGAANGRLLVDWPLPETDRD